MFMLNQLPVPTIHPLLLPVPTPMRLHPHSPPNCLQMTASSRKTKAHFLPHYPELHTHSVPTPRPPFELQCMHFMMWSTQRKYTHSHHSQEAATCALDLAQQALAAAAQLAPKLLLS